MKNTVILLLVGLAVAAAVPDWYYQHPDSMPRLGTNKLFYLEQKHGLTPRPSDEPESLNVRMVGKWGGGPSWGVTGKDTLVYLSRGSEVVVINFADTANPQILNHIQAKRLAGRPVLQDSLLYLATSGYIEVFNVSDPVNAERVGRLATPVSDIDVEDTLVYTISADSFKVYSFADPGNPYLVGACQDSGIALDVENGYAYLCDRWGLYILDARDPANPHRLTSWGSHIEAVRVRGNHCYVTTGSTGGNSLFVLNVSDPANPWQEGVNSSVSGVDIYLVDTLLFLPGFDIVNVADSSQPTLVSQTPVGGPKRSVWVDDSAAWGFVAADYVGLHFLSLSDIGNPTLDTTVLGVGEATDISVAGGVACVACFRSDAVFFDISDPACPREVGRYAGPGYMNSVLNVESLAYVNGYSHTHDTVIHVVDITDPANPVMVGAVGGWEGPSAMVLQDSFLYAAEPYRFEVFSVANARQPEWLGRCDAYHLALDIDAHDSLVYISPRLQVFSVADPANPYRISETAGNRTLGGTALRDTFAYVASAYDSLWVFSIADPGTSRVLGGVPLGNSFGYDVALRDSYAYAGCYDFRVFEVTAPASPVPIGYYPTPYRARKVFCDSQYIYTACSMAGVCILEHLQTGLEESRQASLPRLRRPVLIPNPVSDVGLLYWSSNRSPRRIRVFDIAGRPVREVTISPERPGTVEVSFRCLPAGVYIVLAECADRKERIKVVRE